MLISMADSDLYQISVCKCRIYAISEKFFLKDDYRNTDKLNALVKKKVRTMATRNARRL